MVSDEFDEEAADAFMVNRLVSAAISAMDRAAIPDLTTEADLVSAAFSILDYTLRTMLKGQLPEEHVENAREISRVLNEFLIDFGQIRH